MPKQKQQEAEGSCLVKQVQDCTDSLPSAWKAVLKERQKRREARPPMTRTARVPQWPGVQGKKPRKEHSEAAEAKERKAAAEKIIKEAKS